MKIIFDTIDNNTMTSIISSLIERSMMVFPLFSPFDRFTWHRQTISASEAKRSTNLPLPWGKNRWFSEGVRSINRPTHFISPLSTEDDRDQRWIGKRMNGNTITSSCWCCCCCRWTWRHDRMRNESRKQKQIFPLKKNVQQEKKNGRKFNSKD